MVGEDLQEKVLEGFLAFPDAYVINIVDRLGTVSNSVEEVV